MLSFIILVVILNLIRFTWGCHKDKKAAGKTQSSPEECRQAESWAVIIQKKMEVHGLGDYLYKDFRFKEQLTSKDLKSETRLQKKMSLMMQDLHAYLHLAPGYMLHVKFDQDNSMDRSGQCDYTRRRIDIFPRSHYTADTLMAILAHETAHYFMYQYGLSFPDSELNERCTDTVACLMGLSSYMINGNIGYLKKGQFIAVRKNLCAYRACHQKQDAGTSADKVSPLRIVDEQRLRSQLDAANSLLQQTKAIVRIKKVPTRTDLSAQDYIQLKSLVNELNAGIYDRSLAVCSNLLRGDQANLRTVRQNVLNVCNDLNAVMQMYT